MSTRAHTIKTLPVTLLALLFCALFSTLAPASEKISIKSDGLTLNANLQLAEGKKLADGVILITHGTLAHNKMEIIVTLQELLKERGHNSLAINLSLGINDRKSAPYDCKTPHKHRHWDAADEITNWVGWLKSKGAAKITVLGHSRGGAQTAAYAVHKPDAAVSQVILIAPATWSQKRDDTSYKTRNETALAPVLARAKKLVMHGKGATLLEKTGVLYCANTIVSAASLVSYYSRTGVSRHTPFLLKNIKRPVLVIAGAQDKVVKGLVEMVRPLVKGKKLQLKIIEDADHYFRDFAAEEVADTIDEFIKP